VKQRNNNGALEATWSGAVGGYLVKTEDRETSGIGAVGGYSIISNLRKHLGLGED
jgi:hypothetical protein